MGAFREPSLDYRSGCQRLPQRLCGSKKVGITRVAQSRCSVALNFNIARRKARSTGLHNMTVGACRITPSLAMKKLPCSDQLLVPACFVICSHTLLERSGRLLELRHGWPVLQKQRLALNVASTGQRKIIMASTRHYPITKSSSTWRPPGHRLKHIVCSVPLPL